jgi:DNA polymerase bacteriophage-type
MLDIVATPQPAAVSSARLILSWDVETYSTASIKNCGAFKYAADQTTGVWLLAYSAGDGSKLWFPGDRIPQEFIEAAADPSWATVAHNAPFEAAVLRHVLGPKHGFPQIPIQRFRCTQAMARALGLPAKLGLLGKALELTTQKDAAGARLMVSMASPRKPRKAEPPGLYYRNTPAKLERLGHYCILDERMTREIFGRLAPLSDFEQKLWILDQQINERGFAVDTEFAQAALKIAQATGHEINRELSEITAGEVASINQVPKLVAWLHAQGCHTRTLRSEDVEEQLAGDLPAPVRRVLELRQGGAQAASKKFVAMLARAGADARIRGSLTYHAASTGRWGGEGFQPQNLKRPIEKNLEAARGAVATGALAYVKSLYPNPLSILGDLLRSTIIAGPRCTLIGGDFSSIESRVLAWVAGEMWKLDAYRRFDATRDSRDAVYCETACRIFRVPSGTYGRESPERAIGKTADLAFGYMGGLGAFRNFSDALTDMEVDEAKVAWRVAHPNVVRLWYALDDAAIAAVKTRQLVRCGPVLFKCVGSFLRLKLPSGRKLSYPQPRLILDDRGRPRVVFKDNAKGQFVDCRGGQGAYGGTWTENTVSAIARDLLAEALFRLDAAGFPITLTVHDEVLCEVAEGPDRTQEFLRLLTRKPVWAPDLPIAASVWSGPRYLK